MAVVDSVTINQLIICFQGSVGKNLQTAHFSQISRQTWASFWLVTLAVWTFC